MKFQSNSIFNGTITANSVANAGVDTDKFVVLNASGLVTFRTGAEVLADIGASSSASGLPIGGTAGQILAKIDATNYNTEWIDNYATQVKNFVKLGATLSKGAAVYVSDADGTNMIVAAATNATEMGSSKTLGLLETGGVTNDIVKVVTYGLLAGLDTSTAVAGDPVWLGVNGALIFGLTNKPVAPAHLVYIGEVTRVQQNNGEIFVNVQNGFEMNELHNYLEGSVQNNQVIVYESATSLYKPKSIATILGYTPADAANIPTRTETVFTATANQSVFTVNYTVGSVEVFYNGSKMAPAEFTATNGTSITLASGIPEGTILTVVANGIGGGASKAAFSATAPMAYDSNTGVFSMPAATGSQNGYLTSANWTTFNNKQNTLTLTVTGSSGAATLTDATLNIPTYTLAGLGGQPALSGTGFVKISGTTISYDNSTYYLASNPSSYITNSISTDFTLTGNVYIRNSSPTIYLRDTNHRSSMIHCNSNIFYVLRGNGSDTTTWATYNGYWPMELNLENNNATFGGNITAIYDVTAYSDARVKENVTTIEGALDKVLALRGVRYQRTDMEDRKFHIGVIAQETQPIVPEIVNENDKGHLNVAYGNMGGLFIEAIKELKKENNELRDILKRNNLI